MYYIKNWDSIYENANSRKIQRCTFACIPNKQHGMGFRRLIKERDGLAIFGFFVLLCEACSQQKPPRRGLLSDNGTENGAEWTESDMSLKFGVPTRLVKHALTVLCSERIDWLGVLKTQKSGKFKTTSSVSHLDEVGDDPVETPNERNGTERKEQKEENERNGTEESGCVDNFIKISGKEISKSEWIALTKKIDPDNNGSAYPELALRFYRAKQYKPNNLIAYVTAGIENGYGEIHCQDEIENPRKVNDWVDRVLNHVYTKMKA